MDASIPAQGHSNKNRWVLPLNRSKLNALLQVGYRGHYICNGHLQILVVLSRGLQCATFVLFISGAIEIIHKMFHFIEYITIDRKDCIYIIKRIYVIKFLITNKTYLIFTPKL